MEFALFVKRKHTPHVWLRQLNTLYFPLGASADPSHPGDWTQAKDNRSSQVSPQTPHSHLVLSCS